MGFNKSLIEYLTKHGARRFNGQELEPDKIMKIYEIEKIIKPVDKLLVEIGSEIINKISHDLVYETLTITKVLLLK